MKSAREKVEVHRLSDAARPPWLQRWRTYGHFKDYNGSWLPKHHRSKIDLWRKENPELCAVASYPWVHQMARACDLTFGFVSVTVWSGKRSRKYDSWDAFCANPYQRARFIVVDPGNVKIELDGYRTREVRLKPGQVYEVYFQSQAFWGWNFGRQKNLIFNGFSPADA